MASQPNGLMQAFGAKPQQAQPGTQGQPASSAPPAQPGQARPQMPWNSQARPLGGAMGQGGWGQQPPQARFPGQFQGPQPMRPAGGPVGGGSAFQGSSSHPWSPTIPQNPGRPSGPASGPQGLGNGAPQGVPPMPFQTPAPAQSQVAMTPAPEDLGSQPDPQSVGSGVMNPRSMVSGRRYYGE